MRAHVQLRYRQVDGWPPLAWLARCSRAEPIVEVIHGAWVETREAWFCEAVWFGPFTAGDFDRTDVVFGSGGRQRPEGVVFVSSAATVDRLHVLNTGDAVWVSNSLPCLLAARGGSVDPAYAGYFRDFGSIKLGIRRYRPLLATSAGLVRLVYHANLRWDGQRLHAEAKPRPSRDFGSFAAYRDFLATALTGLAQNMAAPERGHGYRWLGTMSSGYDSATTVTLAREAGLDQALSFDRARGGQDDCGRRFADALGVQLVVVPRDRWRELELPEVPFIAADAKGEEVYFAAAQSHLAGRVLLTGFLGDEIWERNGCPLSRELSRSDVGGLSLSEYRLGAGFLHCPLPFLGALQSRDIRRLARSPELAPWSAGGLYDRPVCRRILEESGVRCDALAPAKRAASVLLFRRETFLTPAALTDYLAWLDAHADVWRRRGLVPPHRAPRHPSRSMAAAAHTARAFRRVAELAPPHLDVARSIAERLDGYARWEPLFDFLFPWALERAKARYA